VSNFHDDLGTAQACLRHDHDDVRRIAIKDVLKDVMLAEVVAMPSMLVVIGRQTFVLYGVVDFFQADIIRRFSALALPAIKRLQVSPPIPDADLIWGCQAAQWAAGQYYTTCTASGRSAGGGPRGMKK
jgi:hypothetical protein